MDEQERLLNTDFPYLGCSHEDFYGKRGTFPRKRCPSHNGQVAITQESIDAKRKEISGYRHSL